VPGEERKLDDAALLRLLWRGDERPSARSGLTVGRIVAAGVEVADAEGLDALSMRRVAEELGVGAMSLYTYVASKAELVELMVDRVLGELRRPDADRSPRDRVAFAAMERWELYHRHPWILQTNLLRFSLGPNSLDAEEALYAVLEAWGVDPLRMYPTAHMITAYVQGAARSSVTDRETERLTGESLEVYFSVRMDFWNTYFDEGRYPVMTKIWNAGGFDAPETAFLFGLERLLDAIEMET
jgi:AcrR family transcriptional regulator